MECVIYFGMNYLTVRADVERFRQDLVALLRTQSHANRVYPGLLPGTNPRDIPGLQEAGWDVKVVVTRRSARDAVNSGLQSALRALHTAICQNADAWPFEKPVDTKVLTDYLDIVKTPVGAPPCLCRSVCLLCVRRNSCMTRLGRPVVDSTTT